ncbi:MAG: hypothetical protein ACOH1V_14715 [Stenotrophomonas sp.]
MRPIEALALTFAFSFAFSFAFVFAVDVDVAVAVAVAVLNFQRLKASRAPQAGATVEAPLSERSEFGRRAAPGEERRAPMRFHRIGSCLAQAVLVTFGKTKVARAFRRESLYLLSRF